MGLQVERLRALREQRGWSQRELARLCGLSATQIYKYENSRSDPTASNLAMMADQFDVSTDYLLGKTDDPRGHLGDGEVSEEERIMLETFRRAGWLGVIHLGAERLSK